MFDAKQFLIPLEARRGYIVAETQWAIDEMRGLFETLGGVPCGEQLIKLRGIDPRSYIGGGKLAEISEKMAAADTSVLLLDFDLSPSQLKNIEKLAKGLVLDRTGVILEIFSRHARSKEAKLQVELARLQYLMPRLTHLWSHFERQRGSGGASLKGKGMGETQIEVDRRLVKDRINSLQRKMKDVDQSRSLHRRSREDLLQVAMVGYTNAGKSTLMNALCHADVLVEDALFATLDSSVRLLNPKSRPAILAIDTVGFIDRLPHNLVASFKSTLSAVLEADLLVHVLDASHPEVRRHYDVTQAVLAELGATDIPQILVLNKTDLCAPEELALLKVWAAGNTRTAVAGGAMAISAHDTVGVTALRDQILKYFDSIMGVYEVVVPYEDGKTMAQICELGRIETKKELEQGTFVRFRTMDVFAKKFNLTRYAL
jgi:GTP-binding protein HflX